MSHAAYQIRIFEFHEFFWFRAQKINLRLKFNWYLIFTWSQLKPLKIIVNLIIVFENIFIIKLLLKKKDSKVREKTQVKCRSISLTKSEKKQGHNNWALRHSKYSFCLLKNIQKKTNLMKKNSKLNWKFSKNIFDNLTVSNVFP